jgi:hypothetical protein
MANLVTPSIEAETEADRLRIAFAEVQTDLQRHTAVLSKLQGELMASRLEVSGARGETVQFQGFLRRAEAEAAAARVHIAELRANAAAREAEIAARHKAEIARLHDRISTLQAEIDALYASRSWRLSAPIRMASRILGRTGGTAKNDFIDGAGGFEYRGESVSTGLETTGQALVRRREKSRGYYLRQTVRRLSWPVRWLWRRYRQAMMFCIGIVAARPRLHRGIKSICRFIPGLRGHLRRLAPSAPPPPSRPIDPNELYIFKAAPFTGDAQGVVTLDQLYQLSRSL